MHMQPQFFEIYRAGLKSAADMMSASLQTRFTGAQLERTVDFWSRMWRAAGDSQVAIIGQAQAQLGQVHSTVRDTTYQQQQEQQRKHQERKSA